MLKHFSRKDITQAFNETFYPDSKVYSMWEGGSIANNRLDEWSDIDLLFIIEDDYVEEFIKSIKAILENIGKIDLSYRLAEPTWHGHSQVFYRLENTSPYLILDIVVMKKNSINRFLEVERHGKPYIYFDKEQLLIEEHITEAQMKEKIKHRFNQITSTFPVFQIFIQKEINRGHSIDAMGYYINMTVKPVIELIGMLERPYRYDFSMRYIHTDFPKELQEKIEDLLFVNNIEDLKLKFHQAKILYNGITKKIRDKYKL
jgi:predicted nucleotidyltransferase